MAIDMSELTGPLDPADVLKQVFSCRDCELRAYQDAIKEIRQARDDLRAELKVRELKVVPPLHVVSRVRGKHPVIDAYFDCGGTLVVVLESC